VPTVSSAACITYTEGAHHAVSSSGTTPKNWLHQRYQGEFLNQFRVIMHPVHSMLFYGPIACLARPSVYPSVCPSAPLFHTGSTVKNKKKAQQKNCCERSWAHAVVTGVPIFSFKKGKGKVTQTTKSRRNCRISDIVQVYCTGVGW